MRLFLAVAIVLLSACAGPQIISRPPDVQQWQHHQGQVSAIRQWQITGRVAFKTSNNGGQADLFWAQRDQQNYDIKLVAPFGGGSSLIEARADGVMLSASDGTRVYENDMETLLERVDDIPIPVAGLRYWIRGVPSPHSRARLLNWDEQGSLSVLEQDGWRVEMRSYKQVGDYLLPKKIFLTRDHDKDVDVRLVITRWELP